MDTEHSITMLISNAGEARSLYLQALKKYKEGKKDDIKEIIDLADQRLLEAHKVQTQLIQNEIRGESVVINLLMIHAQDHLMNALTIKDLVKTIIEECE